MRHNQSQKKHKLMSGKLMIMMLMVMTWRHDKRRALERAQHTCGKLRATMCRQGKQQTQEQIYCLTGEGLAAIGALN